MKGIAKNGNRRDAAAAEGALADQANARGQGHALKSAHAHESFGGYRGDKADLMVKRHVVKHREIGGNLPANGIAKGQHHLADGGSTVPILFIADCAVKGTYVGIAFAPLHRCQTEKKAKRDPTNEDRADEGNEKGALLADAVGLVLVAKPAAAVNQGDPFGDGKAYRQQHEDGNVA